MIVVKCRSAVRAGRQTVQNHNRHPERSEGSGFFSRPTKTQIPRRFAPRNDKVYGYVFSATRRSVGAHASHDEVIIEPRSFESKTVAQKPVAV